MTKTKPQPALLVKFHAILIVALACTPATYAKSPRQSLDGIDAEIQRAMTQMHVPGAAVGVVRDGKVILAKGYGVRENGQPAPVDADTVFSIASMTKSFTTAVMATLVDEGKLAWDQPVRTYLPGFEMFDPVATQLMTPRDLVAHRSGLPRHDFLRFSTFLQTAELVRRVRYLPPNLTFRDGYQYNNLMYATAGYLAGEVGGSTWNELLRTRIFEPVGMTRSNTSPIDSQREPNHASGHEFDQGRVAAIPFYQYDKFGVSPAGSVGSTINDLLKYLQMYLDEGKAGGRQVISADQVKVLWRAVTADGDGAYSLGWSRSQRNGQLVIQHGGAINGFTSQMVLLPQSKIGIVVLNNQESGLPGLVAGRIADRLQGVTKGPMLLPPERVRVPTPPLTAIEGTRPTLALSAYAGDYFHPAYGVVRIVQRGSDLVMQFDAAEVTLTHHHYDNFRSTGFSGMGAGLYQFQLNSAGGVAQLSAPLESAVAPLIFLRR